MMPKGASTLWTQYQIKNRQYERTRKTIRITHLDAKKQD